MRTTFDKTLFGLSLYFFLHSCYVFNIEIFYGEDSWKDLLMPFILGYGPFLFFVITALKNEELPWRTTVLHFLPFIGYFIIFLALLLEIIEHSPALQQNLGNQIFILGILSFMSYTIWSIFAGKKALKGKQKLVLIVFARVLFLFLIMLFVTILFSTSMVDNRMGMYWYRMLIYGCMLIGITIVFNYVITDIFNFHLIINTPKVDEVLVNDELPRYERSALSAEQLQLYEVRLEMAVKEEKLYLDQSLTLSLLAHHLKIPKHHLTQVFSVQVKQSFYQYINGFRIIEACSLLDSPSENMMYLELVAEKSGFNSKVSFNRQFKTIMGCTPSEYRDRLKK